MSPESDKPVSRMDLWFARSVAVAGLVFAVYVPLGWGPPSMTELVPVEGALVSYSLHRMPQRMGNGNVVALMKLSGHPGRFWNDAIENGAVDHVRGLHGHVVRVMYAPHGNAQPVEGDAVKTWGLWIDGVEQESADSALSTDRFVAYFIFPLIGVGLAFFGFLRARYVGRQLSRNAAP